MQPMRDRLQVQMQGDCEIAFTRDFRAPAAVLWRALTEAELVMRWLWADGIPMVTCEMDVVVGGRFRWVWRRPDGTDMGVGGRFLQVEAPLRLVNTELFDDDWTDGETMVVQALQPLSPQTTRLAMVVRYTTAAARDRALASPMAEGMDDAYAKLDSMFTDLAMPEGT